MKRGGGGAERCLASFFFSSWVRVLQARRGPNPQANWDEPNPQAVRGTELEDGSVPVILAAGVVSILALADDVKDGSVRVEVAELIWGPDDMQNFFREFVNYDAHVSWRRQEEAARRDPSHKDHKKPVF